MSELDRVLSILASAGTLLVSVVTLIKVFKIVKQTNHMKDELVKAVQEEARRIGILEGRKQMRDEGSDAT